MSSTNSSYQNLELKGIKGDQHRRKSIEEEDYEKARDQMLNQIIPNEDEKSETCMWRVCCLFYYAFCCCCCFGGGTKNSNKDTFKKRFQKWLNVELFSNSQEKKLSIIKNLLRLYMHHDDAIKDLHRCRINPDFRSSFRNDLEFYIPQLCCFFLKGEYVKEKELQELILLATSASFFFSHRVWFFFQSVMYQDYQESTQEIQDKSKSILKGQKQICLEIAEQLYIANSKDLIAIMDEIGIIDFYPHISIGLTNQSLLNRFSRKEMKKQEAKEKQIDKILKVQQVIKKYITESGRDDEEEFFKVSLNKTNYQVVQTTTEQSLIKRQSDLDGITIEAKDIVLQPYMITLDNPDEHNLTQSIMNLSEEKKFKLQSFLSTPIFIKCLTDLSLKLSKLKVTKAQKHKILKEELIKMNQNLPASVYIPFVNNSIRNYAVLHIPPHESRVFQTKERAPFMISIEVYRPDEIRLFSKKQGDLISTKGSRRNFLNNDLRSSFDSLDSLDSDQEITIEDFQGNPYLLAENKPKSKKKNQAQKRKNGRSSLRRQSSSDNLYRGNGSNSNRRSSSASKRENNSNKFKQFFAKNKIFKKKGKEQQAAEELRKKLLDEQLENEQEVYNLNKIADLRASNAVVIQRYKQGEIDIKKVINEAQVRSNSLGRNEYDQERRSQTLDLNQNEIRFASAQILFNESKQILQGQGEQQQQIQEEAKAQLIQTHRPLSSQASFENFYSDYVNYRSRSEDNLEFMQFQQYINPSTKDNFDTGFSINQLAQKKQLKNSTDEIIEENKEEDENDQYVSASEDGDDQDQSFEEQKLQLKDNSRDTISLDNGEDQRVGSYEDGDIKKVLEKNNKNSDLEQSPSMINNNILIKETSLQQEKRVRRESPFGTLKTWQLIRIIVKSNDDVRQEQFAMQLLSQISQIFKIKNLALWIKPYEILATGPDCGLIEVIQDAVSIDEIHRKNNGLQLEDFFVQNFGKKNSKTFKKAQVAFMQSLAAYSLACYILQIKDRHNQNIMLDSEGHIIHIDYGFFLSNSPGGGLKFEKAPFKMTQEFVNVLGGYNSKRFNQFRNLMKMGFMALQEHADKLCVLVEMMMLGQKDLKCFIEGEQAIRDLKQRFFPTKKVMTEKEAADYIDLLIQQSVDNWRTVFYDRLQKCCQGIV